MAGSALELVTSHLSSFPLPSLSPLLLLSFLYPSFSFSSHLCTFLFSLLGLEELLNSFVQLSELHYVVIAHKALRSCVMITPCAGLLAVMCCVMWRCVLFAWCCAVLRGVE